MARLIVILCFILANVLIVVDFLNEGCLSNKPNISTPKEVSYVS